MGWLLYENILMRNWISVLEGGYRPEADIERLSYAGLPDAVPVGPRPRSEVGLNESLGGRS